MTYSNQQLSSKSQTAHLDDVGDISQIERRESSVLEKDHTDYGRVDKEVAKYASETVVEISEAENKRLRRLIDKRVLSIMIFTYFLQALDKGRSIPMYWATIH